MKTKKNHNPMTEAWSAKYLTISQWAKREKWAVDRVRSSVRCGKLAKHAFVEAFTVGAVGIPRDVRAKDL
jgi:hypothetical protein